MTQHLNKITLLAAMFCTTAACITEYSEKFGRVSITDVADKISDREIDCGQHGVEPNHMRLQTPSLVPLRIDVVNTEHLSRREIGCPLHLYNAINGVNDPSVSIDNDILQ